MLPTDESLRPESFDPMPEVAKILSTQINVDDMGEVRLQGAQAEAWQSRTSLKYRQSQRFLSQLRKQHLLPKTDRSLTDLERTISLEARTRDVQCETDILKDYSEQLSKRVLFCQSLLKSGGIEMKSGLR